MTTNIHLAVVGQTFKPADASRPLAPAHLRVCPPNRTTDIALRLVSRNEPSRAFFARDARRLAVLCRDMAARFLDGGRLLALGREACSTDAQHVAVEFVHPVIVGKRALPALDLSASFTHTLPAIVRPNDIVIGFGPPDGDDVVACAIEHARRYGALALNLAGGDGDYVLPPLSADPFIHQEIVEILYHALWESVHVFFEHRERGHDVGASAFLYPFLGEAPQQVDGIIDDVATSIAAKAQQDEELRARIAATSGTALTSAIAQMRRRIDAGGTLLTFGNGGSATDANDLAIDCVTPPDGAPVIPALSLASEVASITAIANDIGSDAIFKRQVIAHARPADIAVAISTSGGSANLAAALTEARSRGLATVALLGGDGGRIKREGLADVTFVVPCDDIPRIQEVQASIYHVIVEGLRMKT